MARVTAAGERSAGELSGIRKPLPQRARERLRSLRRRLRGVPHVPEWLQVEINNTCNLNCVMCPRQAMRRELRHMTWEEYAPLAEQAAAAGIPRLRLFLLGEPLLHRDLGEMIRYAKSLGVPSVEINTNAALLTPDRSRELMEAGLDEVVFSLDGADRESFESIRRGASYEQVTENVEAFFRLRAESGSPTRGIIQTILMKPTAGAMQQFVERWRPVADLVRVSAVREYQGVEDLSTCRDFSAGELRPCPALWSYLVVLSNLTVVPCCTDINGDLALGDARTESLMDLWRRSPRMQALRRAHLRQDYSGLPLCGGCEFISLDLLREKASATQEWGAAPEE